VAVEHLAEWVKATQERVRQHLEESYASRQGLTIKDFLKRRFCDGVFTRGVNPVPVLSFWPKPGTGIRVPRFLVLGNRNQEQRPRLTTQFRFVLSYPNRVTGFFFKKNCIFLLILGIGLKISPIFFAYF
jgi:hypothetical protein